MGQNQSQVFQIELNTPVYWTHPVLRIGENQKLISCLCLKLWNFKFSESRKVRKLN